MESITSRFVGRIGIDYTGRGQGAGGGRNPIVTGAPITTDGWRPGGPGGQRACAVHPPPVYADGEEEGTGALSDQKSEWR
ncbi:hypothetical protein GCM10010206_05010 [Streptomyces cinerochromogenes]|nr:hypothetical protein GCM10010206_05010 [Streptomyces cinerochromogenes]